MAATLFVVILVAGAIVIRGHEEPYHRYYRLDFKGAEPGQRKLVSRGDGFAAYLLGQNAYYGRTGEQDRDRARKWFRIGADLGNIDAAVSYFWVNAELAGDRNILCRELKLILEYAARAGNLKAAAMGGEVFSSSFCGEPDLVIAAVYYAQAGRIDGRLSGKLDALLSELSPRQAAESAKRMARAMPPVTRVEFFGRYKKLIDNKS